MKPTAFRIVAALTVVCLELVSLPAAAVEVNQDAEVYLQQVHEGTGGNTKQARYEEYHPMPNGVIFDRYTLSADWGEYDLNLKARHIDQLDQEYFLEGGRPGAFTYRGYWNQMPHIYSYSAKTLFNSTGGILILDPTLRAANQGAPTGTVYTNTLKAMGAAPLIPLQVQNDFAGGDLSFHPVRDMTVAMGGSTWYRHGTRGTGGTLGFAVAAELPEPVDQRTNSMFLDIGYAKKAYQLDLRYEYSGFTNNIPVLIWDSWKNTVDANGTSSRGRMPVWPDNTAHSFSLAGGAELPGKTHFSGKVGLSLWRQDDQLVPYTINTAVAAPPFDLTNPANLPDQTAGRKINVYNQFYRFSNSYFDGFRTSVYYKSFQEQNRGKDFQFPGRIPYDNSWAAGTISPERPDIKEDTLGWKGDYDITRTLSAGAGYDFVYKKLTREIPKSNEHNMDAGLNWKPVQDLFVNLSYFLGLRRGRAIDLQTYQFQTTSYSEMPGLVRFDVGDRNRNQGRLQIQYNKGDSTYAASYRVTQDHYRPGHQQLDGGPIGQAGGASPANGGWIWQQYGLLRDDTQAGGLDISQAVGNDWVLDTYYEFDYSRRIVMSNTNSVPGGGVVVQTHKDDWQLRTSEQSNIGGVAVSYNPGKYRGTLGYDIVDTVGKTDTMEDPTGTVGSLPKTHRMVQTLGFKNKYQILKSLALLARYQFQKLDVQDYAWSNLPNVTPDNASLFLGASQKNYYVHAFQVGVDYRF